MPPVTSQWTRRVPYSDQHIRVSDAERGAVAELLGQHYADGRLDQAEFDERVSRTMAAKTRGDLAGLFGDLPDTDSAGGAGPDGPGGPYRGAGLARRGGILRPVLILALVLICAQVAWHAAAAAFFVGQLVWVFAIVAVLLLVKKSRRQGR